MKGANNMSKTWLISWNKQIEENFKIHDMTTRDTEEEARQLCEELKKQEGITDINMYETDCCSM